jgi:carbonic anhydrase
MKKILHFDSPREPYISDAAVVWCFDSRFFNAFRKLLKRLGVNYADRIRLAGGAKCLASPDDPSDQEFVLKQIRISIALHQTRRVILMTHSDCGAYGGLDGGFGGDTRLEVQKHTEELRKAAATVRTNFPHVQVDAYFIDFEGVWEVDVGATAQA